MKHYLYLTFKGFNEAPKVLKYIRDMFLVPQDKGFYCFLPKNWKDLD
jgi:hypothetical protein